MIEFGKIHLQSSNPRILADFISFVFDIPFHEKDNGDLVTTWLGLQLTILQVSKSRKSPMDFKLKVEGMAELAELKQKVEFFYYKTGIKSKSLSLVDNELRFYDPDGRQWCAENLIESVTHIAESETQDVRHF